MEQKYRMLEVGEILREDDEVNVGSEGWVPYGAAGAKINPKGINPVGYYRRPITPRYRDLTFDDTIQPGDEVWVFNRGPWESVSESEYGQPYRNGYWKMRRPVAASTELDEVREAWQKDHMGMKRKLDTAREELESMTKKWYGQRVELADAKNEITDLTRRLEDALSDKVIVEKERDGWQEIAAQHLRNEDFYHGIVTDIGNMFGLKARISDDGTICEGVLALRVPELVAELIIENS